MKNEEILLIIDNHLRSSKGGAAVALEKVKEEVQTRIKAEEEKETQPTGRCKICRRESNRLHQNLYCMECFDKFID